MLKDIKLNFTRGLRDGIPIALGYLSVSFAFGILAVNYGLPIWAPIVTSLTNFTGTGQFVGTSMLAEGAALAEIAFTLLVINARYVLMSVSLAQRLAPDVGALKRLAIAFGNTDEIFAVAMSKNAPLSGRYLAGLILGSFTGWVGGTAVGAVAGSFIPSSLLSALGIALYAMFIAIIVPPAKESRPVLAVVLISVAISCILHIFKALRDNSFWMIIIAGVVSSAAGAAFFPVIGDKSGGKDDDAEHSETPNDGTAQTEAAIEGGEEL